MADINIAKTDEDVYQLITNDQGRNTVLVEASRTAIQETLYLMSVPGIAEPIKKGGEKPLDECLSEKDVAW